MSDTYAAGDAQPSDDLLYESLDVSDPDEEDDMRDEFDDDVDDQGDDPGNGAGIGGDAKLSEVASTDPTAAPDADATPVVVVTRGIRKEFISGGEIVRAVDGVSLALGARQLVTITGPSGCGKTTLLYLLGSLEKPTAGTIVIDGVDVSALNGRDTDEFRRHKIGFVFQSYQLIPNLSALENVMLPMQLAGAPRASRRDRAIHLLRQVGIEEKRFDHHPNKLSGGQQQRVAVARALANDPSVILADEPTGNLDSNNSRRLVNLLRAQALAGRTVVIVTHNRGIARLADVRIDLVDGRVARVTTPSADDRSTTATAATTAAPARKQAAKGKRRR